jgi:hypothetical protein
MDERIDRSQRPRIRRIESHDDARDRARPEAEADQMSRDQLEAVGHGIGERPGGPAKTGEDRDLSGARGHKS